MASLHFLQILICIFSNRGVIECCPVIGHPVCPVTFVNKTSNNPKKRKKSQKNAFLKINVQLKNCTKFHSGRDVRNYSQSLKLSLNIHPIIEGK